MLRAFIDALTRREWKACGSRIVRHWRGDRSSDPATCATVIKEPVPIFSCGFQTGSKHTAGPIGLRERGASRSRDDAPEVGVRRDSRLEYPAIVARRWTPGPKDHAVRSGVGRSDAFGLDVAPLGPTCRRAFDGTAPHQCRTDCRRVRYEPAPVDRNVVPIHTSSPWVWLATERPTLMLCSATGRASSAPKSTERSMRISHLPPKLAGPLASTWNPCRS